MTSVAVVIPAYQAGATLPKVLEAVVPQAGEVGAEVVVVDSTGDGAAVISSRWPTVHVLTPTVKTLPGRARNLGVAAAPETDWLAFVDADAIPDPGWLSALLAATGPGIDAVAGAVRNGTPRHPVGTAGWLLEFSEVMPDRADPIQHGVTCNLLVRRSAFDSAGGFAEDIFAGEDTVFTFAIGQRGGLRFCPHATVRHLNRTGLGAFLRHQRRLGAGFPNVCAKVSFPHGWLSRRPWSVGAGGLRLLALGRRVRRRPALAAQVLLTSPLVVMGLTAWTVGVVSER
jgi:GT2 family glycosyltransferase